MGVVKLSDVDGGASSPATATPSRKRIRFPAEIVLIGSREGCGPLELTRRRRGQIPLRTSLSQIPLKSFGFPGAESARKRFFSPGGQAPTPKKSAPGGDQPKSSISLGRSRSDLLALWASNLSAAQVAGLDWKSRGFTPSRALPGLFWWRFWFPTKQACSFVDVVSDDTGVGRSAPLHPLGGRVREGCAPSRALLGGGRTEIFGWAREVLFSCFFLLLFWRRILFPTTRGWGALLPYIPSGDGVREGCAPSRALLGGGRTEIFGWAREVFFSCFFLLLFWRRILFPTTRGWGAPLPYTPSGDGVREGCAPSRALLGGRRTEIFCMGKGCFVLLLFLLLFWRRTSFPTARAWGAPLPYTPSGDGVREGCAPSRALRGEGRTEIFWMGKGES